MTRKRAEPVRHDDHAKQKDTDAARDLNYNQEFVHALSAPDLYIDSLSYECQSDMCTKLMVICGINGNI
jgi:hypothetical protein